VATAPKRASQLPIAIRIVTRLIAHQLIRAFALRVCRGRIYLQYHFPPLRPDKNNGPCQGISLITILITIHSFSKARELAGTKIGRGSHGIYKKRYYRYHECYQIVIQRHVRCALSLRLPTPSPFSLSLSLSRSLSYLGILYIITRASGHEQ